MATVIPKNVIEELKAKHADVRMLADEEAEFVGAFRPATRAEYEEMKREARVDTETAAEAFVKHCLLWPTIEEMDKVASRRAALYGQLSKRIGAWAGVFAQVEPLGDPGEILPDSMAKDVRHTVPKPFVFRWSDERIPIILRIPDPATRRAFHRDIDADKPYAAERWVKLCLLHPSAEEIDQIAEKKPAVFDMLSLQLRRLAGEHAEITEKKL